MDILHFVITSLLYIILLLYTHPSFSPKFRTKICHAKTGPHVGWPMVWFSTSCTIPYEAQIDMAKKVRKRENRREMRERGREREEPKQEWARRPMVATRWSRRPPKHEIFLPALHRVETAATIPILILILFFSSRSLPPSLWIAKK